MIFIRIKEVYGLFRSEFSFDNVRYFKMAASLLKSSRGLFKVLHNERPFSGAGLLQDAIKSSKMMQKYLLNKKRCSNRIASRQN